MKTAKTAKMAKTAKAAKIVKKAKTAKTAKTASAAMTATKPHSSAMSAPQEHTKALHDRSTGPYVKYQKEREGFPMEDQEVLNQNSDSEDVPLDVVVPRDTSPALVVSKRRPEKEKWCARCGYLVKRDWRRHWKLSHRGAPAQELCFDNYNDLTEPYYG